MSEPNAAAPTETGVPATPAPAPAPPAPPATPAADPPKPEGITLTSEQLKERIDRAREAGTRALLEELGAADPSEIKAALEAKRLADESQKTLEQRLAELQAQREQEQGQLAGLRATVKQRADYELGALSDEQRAAVSAIAGEDPASQLKAITALRPTWASAAAAPADNPAAAPPPKPTGHDAPAPAPSGQPAPTDHAAVYQQLASDPRKALQAANYLQRHRAEIYPARG